ncbi:MAG: hypothetical protein IKI03_05405, partial [Clostridia bacterium]|nr:hypothetical protein [Clostridia bacterium]
PSQVGVATCFGHCLAGTKIISGKTIRPGADDYTSRFSRRGRRLIDIRQGRETKICRIGATPGGFG